MPLPLTPKQLDVLRLIDTTIREKGFAPTNQEIGDEIGVSKVTAFEHVRALVKRGWLERVPNTNRGIRLAPGVSVPGLGEPEVEALRRRVQELEAENARLRGAVA